MGRYLRLLAAAALGGLGCSFGQVALVGNSPFAPSGTAATAANSPAQDFELAGSTAEGTDVSVCIYERQAKHSQWIPVGGIVDGIRVISFDAAHDKAVVMIAGQRREISMRVAAVASLGAPNAGRSTPFSSAPVAPQPTIGSAPAVMTGPEQEQREARMLVSDLLEIGVQQRKAYQEAKQKAASGTQPSPQN